MPTITFIHLDGRAQTVEAGVGESAMMAATNHGVDGISADCGGCANCATCHVYVDDVWLSEIPAPEAVEDAMLEGVAAERRPGSRLSCQIQITAALDGLVLHLPEMQA